MPFFYAGGDEDGNGSHCIIWNHHIDVHKNTLCVWHFLDANDNFNVCVCIVCLSLLIIAFLSRAEDDSSYC